MAAPLAEIVALVAPPACAACRGPVPRADALVCGGCLRALPWLRGWLCTHCGLPRHRGGRCPAAAASYHRAWSPLAYEGVARDLVAALKFRGALPLASFMAAHIAANLPADLRPSANAAVPTPLQPASAPWAAAARPVAVVPVPPQSRRRRRRGFDPAGALAAALARRLGVPLADCLVRRDHQGRQVGVGRAHRRKPGRIVVELRRRAPPRVLLVDDVHTTGATLNASAAALLGGGCDYVAAVSYARTL
jgi:predicted amidophosphoribosyltransferase